MMFDMRGAMPDRQSLLSALWLTTSLALLASVLATPMRTWGFTTVSSRSDCLRRNFAPPPGEATSRLSPAMVSDAVLERNALLYEEEEQDQADAPDDPRVSFLIPFSFPKARDLPLIAPGSIFSLLPLRC
jgi:hypothetical protein